MNGFRIIRATALSLSTLGIVFPQQLLRAEGNQPLPPSGSKSPPVTKPAAASAIPDVALEAGGKFSGRVVDRTGKGLEGAKVFVRQGKVEIGRTVTDKDGEYHFKNLKGGVYQVASGNAEGNFRLWAERTAPPVAKERALLVQGENGARGAIGAFDPTTIFLTSGVIASLVVSSIALNEAQNNNNNNNNGLNSQDIQPNTP